jgi:hypothetical protein
MAYPNFRKRYTMTALAASEMVRKMVAREMRGPSDTGPAMQRLEAKYGLPFWTLEHLRKGRAKVCEAGLFQRLRGAYLDHCERQLNALKHEIELEKARGNDCDSDLLAEAEALLAKIRQRKG